MVGRFVQQKQVRFLYQQSGQVRAHHPAAAHFPGRPVEILIPKTQPRQNLLGLGFETVAA